MLIKSYKFGKEYEFKCDREFLNRILKEDLSGVEEINSRTYEWGNFYSALSFEIGLNYFYSGEVNNCYEFFNYSESLLGEQKGNHFHFSYLLNDTSITSKLFTINMFSVITFLLRMFFTLRNRFRNSFTKYALDSINNSLRRVLDDVYMEKYAFVNVYEFEEDYVHLEFRASETTVLADISLILFASEIINNLGKNCKLFNEDYQYFMSCLFAFGEDYVNRDVKICVGKLLDLDLKGLSFIKLTTNVVEFFKFVVFGLYKDYVISTLPLFNIVVDKNLLMTNFYRCLGLKILEFNYNEFVEDFISNFNNDMNRFGIYLDRIIYDNKECFVFWVDNEKIVKSYFYVFDEVSNRFSGVDLNCVKEFVKRFIYNYFSDVYDLMEYFQKDCEYVYEDNITELNDIYWVYADDNKITEELTYVFKERIWEMINKEL